MPPAPELGVRGPPAEHPTMTRSRVIRLLLGGAVLVGAVALAAPASSQAPSQWEVRRQIAALGWQRGPTEAHLGSTAILDVREGQAFLDAPNTRRFLELTENPPRDNHYTLVGPEMKWFAILFFEDSGYVKDDETLDADALLASLKDSDKSANAERQRLGIPPLHTEGWHVAPHYDALTKRLEWGLRLSGPDGHPTINYTIRFLGRRGVMHATLVSEPDTLERDIAQFKASLTGYSFAAGERYAEFRAGDRVAEYGLAALVLGGAAAVATKSGFAKALGKFVVAGLVALGGAVSAAIRKFRRRG